MPDDLMQPDTVDQWFSQRTPPHATGPRLPFLRCLALAAACCACPAPLPAAPPNILFILTDDQGWPTLGCYGSTHAPTPHLDRLASEGVRFTDAYVTPQCTPTRASLLTGQHTARNGMWHVIPWYGSPWGRVAEPPFREELPRAWPNLAKALRAGGYTTGMAGKWHLSANPRDGYYSHLNASAGPAFGFDHVAPPGPGSHNEGDRWVDHLTDAAITFIREHRDAPWFFYLAHHTIHGAVCAPPALVAKYRAAGAPESGMFNATYLAAIEHLDDSVGRLLAALEETGQRENTLVVFLSDNGGVDTQYTLPRPAGPPPDGSQPLPVSRQEFDNAPLRAGKGSPYEGGIRVPCLLRWPAQVDGGQVCRTPVHVTDWMPTLLAAAGAPPPAGHVLDGIDLLPMLKGGTPPPQRPIFFYLPLYDMLWTATPCAVIRLGDWKLIEYFGDWLDSAAQYHAGRRLELYHLRDDPGESVDLATRHPQRAEELSARLHAWMQSIPVPVPGDNPHHDPRRLLEKTGEKPAWLRPIP